MLVCDNCFGDRHLKNRIKEKRIETGRGRCAFHPRKKGVPIEDVSDIVAPVFEGFYDAGHISIYEYIDNGDVEIVQEGKILSECIEELCQISELDIVDKLTKLIQVSETMKIMGMPSETNYGERRYARYGSNFNSISIVWHLFKERVKHNIRYLDTDAIENLNRIFFGIQNISGAIKTIKKQTLIYRCRLANDYETAEMFKNNPTKELSAPPEKLSKHNRLSAKGITCFYGAFNQETAVAEVRPAIHSLIVSCQFKLRRPIKVIDLTVFREVKDYKPFDKRYAARHKLFRFLNEFLKELETPISPDNADLEYLPAQVVAEYFQHHMATELGKIEGIIFNSSQKKYGKNIALFDDASKCFEAELLKIEKWEEPEDSKEYFYDEVRTKCGMSYVPHSAKMITLESIEYKLG